MFLDREITPDLARELEGQKVVNAHSFHEVLVEIENRTKGNLDTTPLRAALELDYILEQWKGNGSWGVLKGMRVLDLASGSGNSRDMFGTHYYPHFSRICAINGADVVAIDMNSQGELDQAMFMWAAVDLVDTVLGQGLKSLPILQGRGFDMVHSSDFVGLNPCPSLPWQLASHGTTLDEFEKVFLRQAGELLAEGGVMFLGSRSQKCLPILYTKRETDIVQLT